MRSIGMSVAMLFLVLFWGGCTFPGQRLLTIDIERDGLTVFSGSYAVPDSTPVEEMWEVVREVRLNATTASESTMNQSSVAQEGIPGELIIRIMHSDNELASRKIANLEVAEIAEGEYWQVKEISYSE